MPSLSEFVALRAFPLSLDGIRAEMVQAGRRVLVPDNLAPGLLAEGFIALPAPPQGGRVPQVPAPIPADQTKSGAEGEGGDSLAGGEAEAGAAEPVGEGAAEASAEAEPAASAEPPTTTRRSRRA